jgi:hypothetical protein
MNQYEIIKKRHQKDVNDFPMFFAFNNKQFDEGMRLLGLEPIDTDKIYRIPGTGGFYRISDAPAFHEMFNRHGKEMQDAVDGDKTGDGFICDMFYYELVNHEFTYTGDLTSTLEALDLTSDDLINNESLRNGMNNAINKLRKAVRKKKG